jgi:hypothetical protein
VGSDDADEDSVTEINVEVDPSMISEITITHTGASPITVLSEAASPADSEPTTLEPQLVVRGLGKKASSSSPPPPTFAEVGARPGSEADDEEPEEDRTTQNIESHLHEVYEQAVRASSSLGSSRPLTQLSSIIMTPSEPIRLEASRSALARSAASAKPAQRVAAPIPAAGRPPEWEKEQSELTARRGPDTPEGKEIADAIRSSARGNDDDAEEETKTDAVQSELAAFSRAQARTVPLITEDPGLEPEETRTTKAPLTKLSAQAASIGPPLAVAVVDAGRAQLDAQAAAGGTVRMFYNPSTGTASAHPDSERGPVAALQPMKPFGEQPTVQALPLQQSPVMGVPAIVRDPAPASLEATHGSRRKPRRVGRLLLLFLVACAASGAGVRYRHQIRPWMMTRVPASWRAPSATVAPPAPAPETSSSSGASAIASASAEPSTSAAASAIPPASASAAPSASASASAAASAQRNKNKKGPPPKR